MEPTDRTNPDETDEAVWDEEEYESDDDIKEDFGGSDEDFGDE